MYKGKGERKKHSSLSICNQFKQQSRWNINLEQLPKVRHGMSSNFLSADFYLCFHPFLHYPISLWMCSDSMWKFSIPFYNCRTGTSMRTRSISSDSSPHLKEKEVTSKRGRKAETSIIVPHMLEHLVICL